MIDKVQDSRTFLSILMVMFGSLLSPALADIKVIVNDDLITTVDIEEGFKAKLARSKEVRAALMRRFKSDATKARWREMVMTERPTSKAEAQRLQQKLAEELKREISRRFKPKLKKQVLQDLIDERLKYQAAKKSNMLLTDQEMNSLMKRLAGSNKHPKTGKPLTLKQFKQALKSQKVNYEKLKQRLRINNSWSRYVRRKFGHQVSVSGSDIDKAMARSAAGKNSKKAKTKASGEKILKVSFVFPKKSSESGKSKRVVEANAFRKQASSCNLIAQKAALQSNVQIKYINNGMRYAKIRNALKGHQGGQLSAPVMFNDFVALYAKCNSGKSAKKTKTVSSGDLARRKKIENQLRGKEISRLAKKHLRDLRQDANIEYR